MTEATTYDYDFRILKVKVALLTVKYLLHNFEFIKLYKI